MRTNQPHTDETKAAIGTGVKRAAEYRAARIKFYELSALDTPFTAERRLAQLKLVRFLAVRAPAEDRVRWARWQDALERGGRIKIGVYQAAITSDEGYRPRYECSNEACAQRGVVIRIEADAPADCPDCGWSLGCLERAD